MVKFDYDRYSNLKNSDGTLIPMPFIKLPINSTDKYVYWYTSTSRMDKLSNIYYNSPFYDFLILYANSEYVSEFDIPDGAVIRIPYPLSKAIMDYENILKSIK